MTIREIMVAFGFDIDKSSEMQAESRIKGIKNLATKTLGAIGIGLSISGLSGLAETAAEASALKSQFTQVFGEMEDDATSKLNAIADDTGVAVNRMKGSFTQIAAFSKTTGLDQAKSLELADRAMKAVTDSAAFYDRSIEDVTESMRSFLKGNYEQDAALGLSSTETTRNAVANKLYSKSFNDLTEAEKQFTLLSMVEDANKASGALGQAARESDTWMNQLGNLKQSITDLKAAAGDAFLKPAVQVLKALNGMVKKATSAIQGMTGENGLLTRSFDRLHALVKRLQPAIGRFVDKLGGIDNVLKIAAIAAGSFFAVMAVSKIGSLIKGIGGMAGVVGKLAKVFNLANLKMLAIIAVIVILALIVEDFINFMMGNDSVIGTLFDKAGIGADNAREMIIDAWNAVKDFLIGIWDNLGGALLGFLEVIKGMANFISSVFTGDWRGAWEAIKQIFSGAWDAIVSIVSIAWSIITSAISAAISAAYNVIVSVLQAIRDFFSNIFSSIANFVRTTFSNILTGIIATVGGIRDAIVNGFNAAIEFIKGLPGQAVQWGKDFIHGLKSGILSGVQGIVDAVKGIGGKIKSFLHFSVPDEGPLTDYESWMPDFMGGLAKGISDNEDTVIDKVKRLASGIAALTKAAVAQPATATTSTVNNQTSNVTQNVNIDNTYSGGTADAQKAVSKTMKKSATDATTQMARALAYARG